MTTTDLQPLPGGTLSDAVEHRIVDWLRQQGLKPGDPLPGELELAQTLQVSRNVVREALSRLRMIGLVRSRKRAGMHLGEPDIPGTLARVLDAAFLDQARIAQLRELRLVIEIGLAPLVFTRHSAADRAELTELVTQERAVADDCDASRAIDAHFHAVLYRIGDNPMITEFQALLPSFFATADRAAFRPTRFNDPAIVSHADLIHELEHGTAVSFAAAMQGHLTPHLAGC
ncbi:MAG: GntR family transcriptional regulator [Planctomycetota bacterium]|jgi:GntR family transcriptional repressor for pyruvate dehydrogenase complex|nr:GntR family transcriptional regulator [Planctomycetota bacterium]